MPSLTELYAHHHPSKFAYFMPLFERHFAPLRESATSVLEIGVQWGNSVRMWKDYFPQATIHGIEIDPQYVFAEDRIVAHYGHQGDTAFLAQVAQIAGGFDIVIDDGAHRMIEQQASLEALFPCVRPGGLYVIEDLFSSYWQGWGGSYLNRRQRVRITTIDYLKTLVDALHSEHYKNPDSAPHPPKPVYRQVDPPLRGQAEYPGDWIEEPRNYMDSHVAALHFYPSIAFIEKE